MNKSHRPVPRVKSRVRVPSGAQTGHLDWSDRAAVRALVLSLRVHLDDLLAVMDDMQVPRRDRELGAAQHRRIAHDCRDSLIAGLDYALPPESTPPTP